VTDQLLRLAPALPLDVLPVRPVVGMDVLEAALGIADRVELGAGAGAVGGAAGFLGHGSASSASALAELS